MGVECPGFASNFFPLQSETGSVSFVLAKQTNRFHRFFRFIVLQSKKRRKLFSLCSLHFASKFLFTFNQRHAPDMHHGHDLQYGVYILENTSPPGGGGVISVELFGISSMDFQHRQAGLTGRIYMQNWHAELKRSMDMQQGHAARTRSKDTQQRHAARTCSKDMQQGHAAWTCSMDMQHGHEAWRCMDKQQGHAWTCNIDVNGIEAWSSSMGI
jgi:hypothetical protein